MKQSSSYYCLTSILLVAASVWAEQEMPPDMSEIYEEIYQYESYTDIPIESEIFEPPLTFPSPLGVITLYGQFNPTYQSFNDGD